MATDLRLLGTRVSQVDDVTKYLFDVEGQRVEYVGLTNHGAKDVVCVPSQSGCNMGCAQCFLTLRGRQFVHQIDPALSAAAVRQIVADRGRPETNRTLLISFMGMGEPLLDPEAVADLAGYCAYDHRDVYGKVRFGTSTIVPKVSLLAALQDRVIEGGLDMKLHWSLHHPLEGPRHQIMPNAAPVYEALDGVVEYRDKTRNDVEVHYTLFDGNDDEASCRALVSILLYHDLPIKFLRFRERPDKALGALDESRRRAFVDEVRRAGCQVEEYTPPGHDVLGACGEFEA